MIKKRTKKTTKTKRNIELHSLHVICLAIIMILLSAINMIIFFSPKQTIVVEASNNTPQTDTEFLYTLLEENPTYRDGWVQLAKLEYHLGNTYQARLAILKVKELDPNYLELDNLQQLLTTK